MRGKAAAAVTVGLVGAFAFVGPGQAGSDEVRNKYPSGTETEECSTGPVTDKVTYTGPQKLWPPNHKLQDVEFRAVNGGADTSTTLSITSQIDDVAGGDGGPQHDPDYVPGAAANGGGEAVAAAQLRSERSGKGEGRTYTLTAVGTFDGLRTCSLTVDVIVPHDMRGGADWK